MSQFTVSLDAAQELKELRALHEDLQARILETIETLDELRESPELEIFQASEEDESVISEIVSAQCKELEEEIAGLRDAVDLVAEEVRELAGELPL